MRTAIDTNVLAAIWGRESSAAELSRKLADCMQRGSLVVCGAVFAETLASPRANEEFVLSFFHETGIAVDGETGESLWMETGRRYARYAERLRRSHGREEKRVLADFIIGSHALLFADRLMTLDRGRYSRDFPELVTL